MLKILSLEIYAILEWVLMVYQVIMNEMCLMHSLFLNVQMSIISNTVLKDDDFLSFGIAYKKLFWQNKWLLTMFLA